MIGAKDFTEKVTHKQNVNDDISKEMRHFKKNGIYIIIVVVVAIVVAGIINQNEQNSQDSLTTYNKSMSYGDITSLLADELNGIYDVPYERKDGLTSYFMKNRETNVTKCVIEFFTNTKDLEKRKQQLKNINGYIYDIDNSQEFHKLLLTINSEYFYSEVETVGRVLFAFSEMSTDKERKEIIQKYKFLLSNHSVLDSRKVALPENSKLYIKTQMKLSIQKDQNRIMKNIVLQKESFDQLKGDVYRYNQIDMYKDFYQLTYKSLQLLENKTLDGSKEYQEILDKLKKIVYEAGTYTVGEDILEGYYIFVSESSDKKNQHVYVSGVYQWNQDLICYLKVGKKITFYEGTQLYSLENSPKLNLDGIVNGVFKVGQHLKAGSYEVMAKSTYPCEYWIVDEKDFIDFTDRINRKDYDQRHVKIMHGKSRKIELKENQYLFLLEGQLKKG